MHETADELDASMGQVSEMDGATINAYRAFQRDVVEHVRAAGTWSDSFAVGLELATAIVKAVHDVVRELFSSLVGAVIVWAAELLATVGLATPVVIEQIATRVASLATRASRFISPLMDAINAFIKLLSKLGTVFGDLARLLKSVLNGGTPPRPPGAPTPKPVTSGTPGSGTGGLFASDAKLNRHYAKHGDDFGAESIEEYASQADDFLTGDRGLGTLELVRSDGTVVRYNPDTDEFGLVSPDGVIYSYYKPDPAEHGYDTNLEYFNAQYR
jgi:hypothetical protein